MKKTSNTWKLDLSDVARAQIKKLDREISKRILGYLKKNVLACDNPRLFGDSLVANMSGLWRYRVGGYRVICKIEDDKLIIMVLKIAHRREVYE